jgi:hypothetical protein
MACFIIINWKVASFLSRSASVLGISFSSSERGSMQ